MKKFIWSCVIFVVILALIAVHSVSMIRLGNEIKELSGEVERYAENEDWEKTIEAVGKIKDAWDKRSLWTALTIRTDEIEKIEISLAQVEKYAKMKSKGMFMGEFIMFSKLVEHIPDHEGLNLKEIL